MLCQARVRSQIDTDVCEEPGFSVSRRGPAGDELTPDELADQVATFLISRLGTAVYDRFSDRILFAVCVDSIECSLLPFYYTDVRRSKTTNCLGSLNRELAVQENFSIDAADKRSLYYEKLLRAKKCSKRNSLERVAGSNPSLTRFIRLLDGRFPHAAMLTYAPGSPAGPALAPETSSHQ